MEKIVDSGFKIDLHIHSLCSKGKDLGRVSYNTLENIPTLVKKLTENKVKICAITDHDNFDYSFYEKLKESEKDKNSSIVKVFPGIEFSVEFKRDNKAEVIHVIAIFSDENDEKVKLIPSKLKMTNGFPAYDRGKSFSEEKFLSILRDISIDTVLIAHQKGSLSSARTTKNDVRTLGDDTMREFVYTDYFEAFEFKNRRNEVFNKNFLSQNNLREEMRFITGSDCHDWRYYPKADAHDETDFKFTYIKCLPTFRGLVMAITDYRRIKTVNSFFNPNAFYIPEIEITISGVDCKIPLSRGINVIIGDNSIGKSLLLHKITGNLKQLKKTITSGYDSYLKTNGIIVKTKIQEDKIFGFDSQGEIREKFEQKTISSDTFFRGYYPAPIVADPYKEKVQRKLKSLYNYLSEKFAIEKSISQLSCFNLLTDETSNAESLSFIGTVARKNAEIDGFNKVVGELGNIAEKLHSILENSYIEHEDKNGIETIIQSINDLINRYNCKKEKANQENTKIGLYLAAVESFKEYFETLITDSQKIITAFNDNMSAVVEDIFNIVSRKKDNSPPSLKMERENIQIVTNTVFNYAFNSRLEIVEINEDYIEKLLASCLKKGTKKSVINMTSRELLESLLYIQDSSGDVLKILQEKISREIDSDFSNIQTITVFGKDKNQELSSGFNSQIYFDILSYEKNHRGIYIIDQPEDNVSQKAIKDYLLERFKAMGEYRQVIIVTHNPQFIVNLDVDNVIYLGKSDEQFFIHSGALEYKNENYSILDIISSHIEGGLETIKNRWKRYEKGNSI